MVFNEGNKSGYVTENTDGTVYVFDLFIFILSSPIFFLFVNLIYFLIRHFLVVLVSSGRTNRNIVSGSKDNSVFVVRLETLGTFSF